MENTVQTKVITGKVRFSYVHIDKPHQANANAKAKYSVSLIINKKDTVTVNKIKAACKAALERDRDKIGLKNGPLPTTFKMPLRDGDTDKPGDEAYAGCYFINASSERKPGMVDAQRQEILDPNEIYSGCYGRASINFYCFSVSGNRGIAAGLNNLQFLEDGEALGGGFSDAASDFDDGSETPSMLD